MDTILSYLAEGFDLPILEWIAMNLRCPFLDTVMPALTRLGDGGFLWILTAVILLLLPKYRQVGLGIGISLIIGLLVCNVTLKPLVARPRPYDYQLTHFGKEILLLIEAQHDFSFPSGHTISSFEAATVLLLNNRKMGTAGLLFAAVIAFSRLYLYVHYPTDVLASVFLGIAIAFLGNRLAKYVMDFRNAEQNNT